MSLFLISIPRESLLPLLLLLLFSVGHVSNHRHALYTRDILLGLEDQYCTYCTVHIEAIRKKSTNITYLI